MLAPHRGNALIFRRMRHSIMRTRLAAILFATLLCTKSFGQGGSDPSADLNVGGDERIDLEIRSVISAAEETLASTNSSAGDKQAAQALLDQKIEVIIDFSAPITVSDLAAFVDI